MQLQAADLGLGSCWIQIRGRFTADEIPSDEYVQQLLGIPEEYPVVCILTFGHKNEERKSVDTSKLLWEKVHIGTWKAVELTAATELSSSVRAMSHQRLLRYLIRQAIL